MYMQASCQTAPPHGQPGQATAERAAQRRQPNGGAGPEGSPFTCWSSVPTFGGNSPTAKSEPRMTLVTCRGRQMGAHPLAPGEPYSALDRHGPAGAPVDRSSGCPEPSTRQANPPIQVCSISDLVA